jgi:predicted AlkP superfamily phosphohydrolase/phosphomutase
MTTRAVLLGVDGATFSILDPLMADGVMPFLRSFVNTGVRAPLRSIVPALTPPAWTSLTTGRAPGHHGIFDFFRKETATSPQIRFLTARDVGCPTIFDRASAHGLKTTVLNFPLTFPAPQIEGHVVPGGWMPWRQLPLACRPSTLYARLAQLPGFNPRELAMDMAHEEKAIEGCKRDEYEEWIALHVRREQQWFNVLRYLVQEEPSELVAILFDGVDKLQHLCWRFLDPASAATLSSPWERDVRASCLNYFRTLDGLLEEIVGLVDADATVVVASDHGFGAQVRTFSVNTWLRQQGCLAWQEGNAPRPTESQTLGMGQLARHVFSLDWTRTRAFAPMPSGNGIHIVQSDWNPAGVPPAEYEAFRARLRQDLLRVTDPITGTRVVSRVWTREEIFAGPFLALAPDLTLELEDGGLISILASDEAVTPRPEPTGTHRPQGVFVARGPALRRNAAVPEISILDVAPLLLQSLELPIPGELDGRLRTELFEGAVPAPSAQPAAAAGVPAAEAAATEPLLDEEAEAEILKRLQALGYVE